MCSGGPESSVKHQIKPDQSHFQRIQTAAAPNMTEVWDGTRVFQAASTLRVSPEMLTDHSSQQKPHLCSSHSYSPAPGVPPRGPGERFRTAMICPQSPVALQVHQRAPRLRARGHLKRKSSLELVADHCFGF